LPERARLRLGRVTMDFAVSGAVRALALIEGDELGGVVGASPAMREILHQVQRVAPSSATVLLEGESGTGKEVIARALHQAGDRSGGPFVAFDCAAIPASLAESFLFGHERGAFTGADATRIGCFEEADGGTLFLDELGELPSDLQPKLLRALETREVRRIGGGASRKVDVRIVTATNRELAREVNRGAFRADLYYRLAVVVIRIPPLRERPEDIRPLVQHFIDDLLRYDPGRARQTLDGISDDNWQRLEQLPWPGNVRELRNFIERTLALSDGPHTADIPALEQRPLSAPPNVDLDRDFMSAKAEAVAAFERAYLFGQLARHKDNISAAARASGMDRMNFKRVLRKYR
jgi:transcriptional regulator with GAF, ATPase, and Fis domain